MMWSMKSMNYTLTGHKLGWQTDLAINYKSHFIGLILFTLFLKIAFISIYLSIDLYTLQINSSLDTAVHFCWIWLIKTFVVHILLCEWKFSKAEFICYLSEKTQSHCSVHFQWIIFFAVSLLENKQTNPQLSICDGQLLIKLFSFCPRRLTVSSAELWQTDLSNLTSTVSISALSGFSHPMELDIIT